MITTPNGKTLMNEQEAIQWLLDNNALPFQCTANYAAGTEIGLGTIVNPSPAKVRIGSLIFFADSKVSTVVGITSNGFICSDQYNDLVDDIVYVSNVQLNASGHLIVTLSNGDTIDAGLIKQVSGFSINASQHLIVSYNDGTSTDLGAIFSGNINISGTLTADEILENMTGYSFTEGSAVAEVSRTIVYAGAVKTGNKLTLVITGTLNMTTSISSRQVTLGNFTLPAAVASKLYPYNIGISVLDVRQVDTASAFNSHLLLDGFTQKSGNNVFFYIIAKNTMVLDTPYYFRYELTFLLSDNLAA